LNFGSEVTVLIRIPYDFPLTLRVINSYSKPGGENSESLQIGARIDGRPAVIKVKIKNDGQFDISSYPVHPAAEVDAIVGWVLLADLALQPFYALTEGHPIFGRVVKDLAGLKPMRPASLLEMAVIVISEQQISITAAAIRARLVARYGDLLEGVWVFPDAHKLAGATVEDLRACGYSQRKAEYILEFARRVDDGRLDLEALKDLPDEAVRSTLVALRGWGAWSANYFLVRGLARPDCLPSDDLAIRGVVGRYLGDGSRASVAQVEQLLAPFAPYRGMAAFYLEAHERLLKF
jgi:DNA-3-methyladenine glycosylase II